MSLLHFTPLVGEKSKISAFKSAEERSTQIANLFNASRDDLPFSHPPLPSNLAI
jgi:hypothetical protein